MTYLDQWAALASRIKGLTEAGRLHADFLAVTRNDSFGRGKYLRNQCASAFEAIRDFRDRFGPVIPQRAASSIDNFLKANQSLFSINDGNPDWGAEKVSAVLVFLPAFETAISYIISDVQQSIRARSERAFAHLQRSIVADPESRDKWQRAFAVL